MLTYRVAWRPFTIANHVHVDRRRTLNALKNTILIKDNLEN